MPTYGNFGRFERDPRLDEPIVAALRETRTQLCGRLRTLGRAADLWALVELAGNPVANPVRDLASELLLAQARSGDLRRLAVRDCAHRAGDVNAWSDRDTIEVAPRLPYEPRRRSGDETRSATLPWVKDRDDEFTELAGALLPRLYRRAYLLTTRHSGRRISLRRRWRRRTRGGPGSGGPTTQGPMCTGSCSMPS